MTELNYLTMLTAIRSCCENHGYRVGIFVKRAAEIRGVYDDITSAVFGDREESGMFVQGSTNRGRAHVRFTNDSEITILTANESARSFAFDDVLYDQTIWGATVDTVIRPTERLQYTRPWVQA